MGRKKDLQELALLQAISGVEDPEHLGIQIEDNYLLREKMENLREQGYDVPEEYRPQSRSQEEKDMWRREKEMERLEQSRTNRLETPYDGAEEEDMAKDNKKGGLELFDLKGDNKVTIKITGTLTLSKIVRWRQGKKGERTGEIEKSYIVGHLKSDQGKELKIIMGAQGNVWCGKAIEEVVKEEVITV